MRSTVRPNTLFLVATVALAGPIGCSNPDDGNTVGGTGGSSTGGRGGTGGTAGRGGNTGGSTTGGSGGSTAGGSGGTSAGGTGGTSTGGSGGSAAGAGGSTGGTGTGGAGGSSPGTDGGGDDGGASPDAPPSSGGDWMGYPGVRDLSQVAATEGCGKQPDIPLGMWRDFMITGIPVPPGQRDNPGDGTRKYFVRLPPSYNPATKYKVLIAASSCTGGNQNLAAMGDVGTVTDGTGGAILISPVVEPGVWDRDQCYDDKDPNSIENPFLERFLDQVGSKYCYDKNKVFVQGHSSGGWYSNMIGFTWTTDRIRGFSSNGGGLPDDSAERPKINGKPMAGLWIHPTGDMEQPMAARRAVSRALVTNKCEGAGTNLMDETVWQRAPGANWAMGGAIGCKKFNCPAAFPVIFCQPPGPHENIAWHTDAAWAMFNMLP
jgi:hypothetical protein